MKNTTPTLLPDELAVWYIGQCGFLLRWREKLIAVDPFLNDLQDEAGNSLRLYDAPCQSEDLCVDVVFCTHGHIDHLAAPTLLALLESNPAMKIVVPVGCRSIALAAGLPASCLIFVSENDFFSVEDIKCITFSAAHPEHVTDPVNADMALGYRLDFDGFTVTHLGDTYCTDTLRSALLNLGPTDVLIPPINGDDEIRKANNIIGNMEPEEAAALAVEIGAVTTIPAHYDLIRGNTSDPWRFVRTLRALSTSARFWLPVPGEERIFKA